MNFTTSGIGIFMAIRLDEIFRVWPAREERIELTGHWHVLSAIIATIILLYYGDMIGLKGKVRQVVWLEHHHPFRHRLRRCDRLRDETSLHHRSRTAAAGQRADVSAMDFGLGMLLTLLAVVMVWRLIDLFKPKGRWTEEVDHELSQEVMK